ncbi:alpha-xenorhabdolysin family binary toxin subunit A [Pseudomonas faucium]|uniref:alpha-xenorhabdolysin family binary toxin subunit A n=1 Tax=Pseudomonas faucium TaxID=2740518 RepID=UPI0015969A99|nr:alpha-xenorhabdolysin family binary toxin subunit A [Pseudomonas faucium]
MSSGSVEDLPLSQGGDAKPDEKKPFDQLTEEQRAILIPSQIFNFKREAPAFIFSQENLTTIKRYTTQVNRLPGHEKVVGEGALAILGLDATDVNHLFDNLRAHVRFWGEVEDACKDIGAELHVFAEGLIDDGEQFLKAVEKSDSWKVVAEDLAVHEAVKLSEGDSKIFNDSVDTYLRNIAEDIAHRLESIRHVRKLIDRFGDMITDSLEPEARGLYGRFDGHDAAKKLLEIETELASLSEAIEQKLSEYSGLVGSAFFGLLFGPIGLAITGGIYGAKAEAVRADKNELIDKHVQLSARKNALLGGGVDQFESIKSLLRDMQFRLVEVSTAAKNLEDVWVLLEAYANSSLKKVEGLSTQLEFKRFVRGFQRVISPWTEIVGITGHISKLFNESVGL